MGADNWDDCPKCKAERKFREDYDIGMYEGNFEIEYHGQCSECGFTKTFEHKELLEAE